MTFFRNPKYSADPSAEEEKNYCTGMVKWFNKGMGIINYNGIDVILTCVNIKDNKTPTRGDSVQFKIEKTNNEFRSFYAKDVIVHEQENDKLFKNLMS